ncbi:MAG: hypothetical protein JO154_19715 [Chitinophaga sp.]|uniref:hypothetical protein n=1 Tax=Chitinophaga sp. TaxID=1869181 RepID=UPI0025C1011F|nr:hypothetical protein [Chitinophaga sp.]MBV8254838.1 hypothetical protein [Chitinophaga sp.]
MIQKNNSQCAPTKKHEPNIRMARVHLERANLHLQFMYYHFFGGDANNENINLLMKILQHIIHGRYEEIILKVRSGKIAECTGKEMLTLDKNARLSEYTTGSKGDLNIRFRPNGLFADRYVKL